MSYMTTRRIEALATLLVETRASAQHRTDRGERNVQLHRAACLFVAEQLRKHTVAR